MKTVSLELAKTLKEKGYPQKDNTFYWVEFEHNSMYEDPGIEERTHLCSLEEVNERIGKGRNYWERLERGKGVDDIIAAPTTDEILDKLPDVVFGNWLTMSKTSMGEFELGYAAPEGFIEGHMSGKSLCEAAAKLWLYLKQNKLLGEKR